MTALDVYLSQLKSGLASYGWILSQMTAMLNSPRSYLFQSGQIHTKICICAISASFIASK